ncbi:fimbrial protein [Proteus faecis]|uniref:fimbrial protein n=1 Tax=Proteus faecis TaxID=2050967 RepID=UPI00257F1B26|nr:fimbrial protein [Proteus faecis]MDM3869178.1 fimbrial protein [Proteus faecis]
MIIQKKLHSLFNLSTCMRIIVLFLSFSCFFSSASNKNADYYRAHNKGISAEDSTGQLYVFGTLTESTCHIEMNSIYQSINMGNIPLTKLKKVGDKGEPISFQIALLDCLETPTLLNDRKDHRIWSSEQPGVKIRFIANIVPFFPQLIRVSGIEGLGLQISDLNGRVLPLHADSIPYFLNPGQNQLTFLISPVKTAKYITPGYYNALISFELLYD